MSGEDQPPLAHLIADEIAAQGPMGLDRFMALALGHPDYGYYMRGDPFGAAGDFVTAPEVSQIFGELIGLWLADRWTAMGQPPAVNLVELGPGRGTLMADCLRAMQVVPDLSAAVSVHFVETSPALRQSQAKAVPQARWHDSFGTVPGGPLLLIANEFFDALPIRQFLKTDDGWAERAVALQAGDLALSDVPVTVAMPESHIPPDRLSVGDIVEVCPAAGDIMSAIAGRIAEVGGAALVVDYGYTEDAPGDTLQAVRRHRHVDILDMPGMADLTAHVNFRALARAAEAAGAAIAGPVTQGDFLDALGIRLRLAMLEKRAGGTRGADLRAAVRRLTAPDMMGALFKAMAILPPDAGAVAGFSEGFDG